VRLPEYDWLDALGLGELVARREVSPAELLEAALERADARNSRLNAIVARYDDEARARAAGPLPAGPLSGVPFLLKDLLAAWKGHPLTGSSALLEGFVPDEDAEVVRRFHAAGLVTFGQTNTPELGIMGTTEPRWRGPTRNPWDQSRSAGGSSGGSAAAVAAAIVPAAHGNDGGGSLRIPASACGAFALKPSRGRVPLGPPLLDAWQGFATDGVITRTVRDSAALLDAIAGPAPGDPGALPAPARPFLAEAATPPGRLRLAVTHDSLFGRTTGPDCRAAVDAAAGLLADLGHELVDARPPFSRDALVRAYLVTVSACVAADLAEAARLTGRRPSPALVEPETWGLAAAGRAVGARDLELARREIQAATRAMATFFQGFDGLVLPTLAHPPLPLGAVAMKPLERLSVRVVAALRSRALIEKMLDEVAARSFEATGNTMLWNQTGQPAMTLPLHATAAGLPVGVQVVGRHGDEATLFRLAAQIEAARPWADRLPPTVDASAASAANDARRPGA
jgi:amidase